MRVTIARDGTVLKQNLVLATEFIVAQYWHRFLIFQFFHEFFTIFLIFADVRS